ncbi:MAG: hypothetical protein ACI81V_000937 [Lentimonas sp.]|jgi:hypothetical protein
MQHSEKADSTYRNDRFRAPFLGMLEAGWSTFALVVAIRYFNAPENTKALIAGAGPIGFLLTPITLYAVAKLRARPSQACACIFAVTAVLLLGASAAQSLILFGSFAILSQVVAVQHTPLMLQIYMDNYTSSERGNRMSTPFILTAISAIAFSLIGGKLLDASMEYYHWIFAIMALAAAIIAWSSRHIPSTPLSTEHVGNPWQNFSLIWKDGFFGYLLGSWMLLGLGNLITLPIRVEYLANPKYGINADNTTIALILLVIPAIARILSTRVWSHLFDQMHLITTRNLLNLFFFLGVGGFFISTNLITISVSMIFFGVALGGGKIIWGLWVTKIAPPEKASSYMSVHLALTGVRGTLAPFLGYWVLTYSTPGAVAIFGMTLIAIASILFELIRGHARMSPAKTA